MINRFILFSIICLAFLFIYSCSNDIQKRENYKITLIDLEQITLNPDSLFTNIPFNYNVLYDYIEGIVDGGPFPVSDVEVVWISNFFYLYNNTGNYSKCDNIKDSYFECINIDKDMLVIDTLSVAGDDNIYTNNLVLSKLMIGDTLILHYEIYKNGEPLDYYYKDIYNDLIILPIN
tara:strand:+ start:209 stop:736 length:528 start_codon:yes stop_codon:yes gene_type:complete